MSFLLLLGISTILLDAFDLSVFLTVPILFFSEIGGVMAYSTTFCFDLHYLSTMSVFPSSKTVSVVVTNACLVSSKSPIVFLNFSLGVSDYSGNGKMVLFDMI